MPEKDIRGDLWNNLTLPFLGALKQKWRVSMIALLYRADDLGFLSYNQKKYLLQQFNEQQIRRREPLELDLPIETPTMIKTWINQLREKHNLDVNGIAKLLHVNTNDFIEFYY